MLTRNNNSFFDVENDCSQPPPKEMLTRNNNSSFDVENDCSQPPPKEMLTGNPAPNEYSSDKATSAREPVEIEKNNQFMSQLQKLDKSEPSLGM